MLREAARVGELRILFLQMCRIGQHESAEVRRAGRAVHRSLEPLRDEPWQPSAVVDVGMREDDDIDGFGWNGERSPVAQAEAFESLEQSAIDQDALAVDVQQVLGAGHGTGGSEKR